MPRFVYIHGLNTYGDDDLHLGPLNFGPMSRPWADALGALGSDVFVPSVLGAATHRHQAEHVLNQLDQQGWLNHSDLPMILIGHSSGGLTARVLAALNAAPISAVITVATPHHGCPAAEFMQDLILRKSKTTQLLKHFGYDANRRLHVFDLFRCEQAARFNLEISDHPDVRYGHVSCEVDPIRWCWPLQILSWRLRRGGFTIGPSDGLIPIHSQAWGEQIGRFLLDHFANQGFFLGPRFRQEAKTEFSKMVRATFDFAMSTGSARR